MTQEPDLSFDIDALFDHLVNNLDHDLEQEMDWMFTLRAADVATLEQASELIDDDEFMMYLHEHVEEIDEAGNSSEGRPLLSVIRRGALGPVEVKAIAARLSSIEGVAGLDYEGVECVDVMDENEMYGWMDLESAVWRLRSLTDSGLEQDLELPWVFLILNEELEPLQAAADAYAAAGYERCELYDEVDEEGLYGLCVLIDGSNNEQRLSQTFAAIAAIAEQHGSLLEGVQFYSEDELHSEDEDFESDD